MVTLFPEGLELEDGEVTVTVVVVTPFADVD